MAGNKRPSFLKRQKEQARLARAAEKREARRARKHNKTLEGHGIEGADAPEAFDMADAGEDAAGEEQGEDSETAV